VHSYVWNWRPVKLLLKVLRPAFLAPLIVLYRSIVNPTDCSTNNSKISGQPEKYSQLSASQGSELRTTSSVRVNNDHTFLSLLITVNCSLDQRLGWDERTPRILRKPQLLSSFGAFGLSDFSVAFQACSGLVRKWSTLDVLLRISPN
jgi:hypothetical protein